MTAPAGSTARQLRWASLGLLVVSVTWGSSFVLTKPILTGVSAPDFLAQRFAVAAVVAGLVLFRYVRRLSRRSVARGVLLGALYGVAQVVQTDGLARTSVSVSAFVTGTYVLLTPVCAVVLLRTRIPRSWWVGALLAVVGLAVMSLDGIGVTGGALQTLLAAVIYSLHIVGLSQWSTGRDALGLSVVQLAAVALVCGVWAAPGGVTVITGTGAWVATLYMAVVSGAAAMIVQSWAQAHLPAPRAAIIMVTEPVWASALAVVFLDEPLTWRILAGGGAMLGAMLLVELAPKRGGDPPRPEEVPLLG